VAAHHHLKRVILLAFATPTALSVVAKFDKRLDFGPLLGKAILNFKAVSELAWAKASYWVPILGRVDHLYLSFLLLLMSSIIAPAAYAAFTKDESQEPIDPNERNVWRYASLFSMTVLMIVFGVFGAVFAGIVGLILVVLLLLQTFLPDNEKGSDWLAINAIMTPVLGVLFLVGALIHSGGSFWDAYDNFGVSLFPYALSGLIVLIALLLVWTQGSSGPAIVLALSVSVISLNFLDVKVRPMLTDFLCQAEDQAEPDQVCSE